MLISMEAKMKRAMPSVFRSLLLGIVILPSTGCGGSGTVSVKGVVTLDGEPLPKATVSFMPLGEGRAAYGVTDAKGNFRLTTFKSDDGVLPGEYKVLVMEEGEEKQNPKTFSEDDKKAARTGMKPKSSMPPIGIKSSDKKASKPSLVPAIYRDPQKSPLRQVIPPPGKIELALSSKS
jgi:hypothetical protein